MAASASLRLQEKPWILLGRAMGGPRQISRKLKAFLVALWGYGSKKRVEPRLRRLRDLGYIERIPTRIQRMAGAVDMLRFFIVPCAADYYKTKGINFYFHTLLRFLDDPASVIDPTGFNSSKDAIIGHVMQVVHANPCYDFQLLESFEGGLEEMEQQVVSILDGSHPRAESIRAIVEEEEYLPRLLAHIREYRRDRHVTPLIRENIQHNPGFLAAERVFGTVPGAMNYFATLPQTFWGAVRHLWRVHSLPAARELRQGSGARNVA